MFKKYSTCMYVVRACVRACLCMHVRVFIYVCIPQQQWC